MHRPHTRLLVPACALLLAAAIAGCKPLAVEPQAEDAARNAVREASAADTFRVAYGRPLEVARTGLQLHFEDVADSRCPADATCIWAGEAKLRFLASVRDHQSRIELQIPGLVAVPYEEAAGVTLYGHRIRLLRVDPYPDSRVPDETRYEALLSIEQVRPTN